MLHHYIYFIFFYSKTDCYFSIIKIASFSFALNYHRKETKIPIALIPLIILKSITPQLKRKIRVQHCYIFQFKIRKDFLQPKWFIPATIGSHRRINVYSFVFDEQLQNREIHRYLFPIRFPNLLKSSPASIPGTVRKIISIS